MRLCDRKQRCSQAFPAIRMNCVDRAEIRRAALPLALGLVLRALFVLKWPLTAGDPQVYGNIARTWLEHHVYGLTNATGAVHPTLIRLPGYPAFLAICFAIFGAGKYAAAMWTQVVIDLCGCLLLSRTAANEISPRAGTATLWLAVLCPFTANYCAAPLTETLSIVCVAAALYCAARLLRTASSGEAQTRWAALLGLACSYAVLLRPDGMLLPVAVAIGMVWALRRRPAVAYRHMASGAAIVIFMILLPLVPWTVRNWHTFHVFQPLAPRYANDPGELSEAGYKAWVSTWFLDDVSNEEFYWNADDTTLDPALLPARALDTSRGATLDLLDRYNDTTTMTPELDAQFAQLAQERRREHPLRSRVLLPAGRLADMWLRPRTQILPVASHWWDWHSHPWQSLFAIAYALLNLSLLLLALDGARRLPGGLAATALAYVALRCVLLLTIENAEPRYTLECFPVVLLAAGAALATCARPSSSTLS